MKPIVTGLLLLLLICSCEKNKSGNQPAGQRNLSLKDSMEVIRLWKLASVIKLRDPDSAIRVLDGMRDIYQRYGNVAGLMKYYVRVAGLACVRQQPDTITGKKYTDSAWLLATRKGNEGLMYKAYHARGKYYMAQKNFPLATTFLVRAMNAQPQVTDTPFVQNLSNDLAFVSNEGKNYEQASDYYEPVVRLAEQSLNPATDLVTFLNAAGYANAVPKMAERRRKYLFRAKALMEKNKDTFFRQVLFVQLAQYYDDIGMVDSSVFFASKVVSTLGTGQNPVGMPGPYIYMARHYLHRGDYLAAEEMLKQLNSVIDIGTTTDYLQQAYFYLLYQTHKKKGDIYGAYAALEKLDYIREKMRETEKDEQLLRHQQELKKLSAEKTIEEKNSQIEKQHLYTTFLIIFSILLALLLLMVYLYWRNKKKQEAEKWQDIQRRKEYEAQKKLFEERSRIAGEMHDDLGGTLTSTIMAIELIKMKPGEAAPLEMISRSANQLSDQINEIIWNMNIKNDNLESLSDYILCFTSRFLEEASIHLSWNEHLAEKNIAVSGQQRRAIYLCVKELINNIVKHAKATKVVLDIVYLQNLLTIEIKDNGLGICNSDVQTSGSGNGMENVRKRIEFINGTVVWKDETPGTLVHIMVPLP